MTPIEKIRSALDHAKQSLGSCAMIDEAIAALPYIRESSDGPTMRLWCGKPVESLTREELLTIIQFCSEEIDMFRRQRAFTVARPPAGSALCSGGL